MKVISAANESVLKILSKSNHSDNRSRRLHYCVDVSTEDGMLLYNLLTKELLLLSEEEYAQFEKLDHLKSHWFVVPDDLKDREYADLIKWVVSARQKKPDKITSYTIFTTMDCNARCFYCFELGRPRIPMSKQTALKVAEYIISHCKNEKVNLAWFGGEPLFNYEVIDIICESLRSAGIEYTSTMTSNGYLFNDEMIQKAVNEWKLSRVQITLDGTETIYNKIKAYIYREGNPYQIVLSNLGRLLDAAVRVNIRLNMDLYNAEDLLTLVEDIAQRFEGKRDLSVYASHLFKEGIPSAELHSEEEWHKRDAAMCRLTDRIAAYGLSSKRGINKKIKLNHCMADSGNAVTIMPDGNIGLCEHFTETEFIGHIDHEGFDQKMVDSWKETIPEIPECAECFYYPDCIKLKKCTNDSICYPQYRTDKYRKIQKAMLNEYQKWKESNINSDV